MLTLYYAPNTCALASHIALIEADATYELRRIDFAAAQQRSPDYLALNPKGRVPALVTLLHSSSSEVQLGAAGALRALSRHASSQPTVRLEALAHLQAIADSLAPCRELRAEARAAVRLLTPPAPAPVAAAFRTSSLSSEES